MKYRVSFVPGTDTLLALCDRGATDRFDDPERTWAWLLDHPWHEPDGPEPYARPRRFYARSPSG